MINKLLLPILFILATFSSCSQIYDPVKWDFELIQNGSEATLKFIANIESKWHVYSQTVNPNEGPIPTSFHFETKNGFKLIGKTSEPKPHIEYDPNFDMDLAYFDKKVTFSQKINIESTSNFKLEGYLEFMACNDEMCLPPSIVDFSFDIKGNSEKTSVPEQEKKVTPDESKSPNAPSSIPQNSESNSSGKIHAPVKWSSYAVKVNEEEYDITLTAKIDPSWHVYAQKLESDMGPVPTSVIIDSNLKGISLIGSVTEKGDKHTEYDENFAMDLSFYEKEVSFIQRVKVSEIHDDIIKGTYTYMVCNDEMCLPPTLNEFQVSLSGAKIEQENDDNIVDNGVIPHLEKLDIENPINDCGNKNYSIENDEEREAWWVYLLWGLGGGFIALLTPCVYPMIPLTVSYFTKGESKPKATGLRDAMLYGFFIFLIYILISLPFHITNADPQMLNKVATGSTLNIIFFIVFVFFALSFFGFYELTLPSKWGNKVDSASNMGGFIGIFLMALTLAIVSFSCTGPILGSVLAKVLKFGPMPLTYTLAGFGLALGLPFAIFAAAPNLMKSLPTSGGWMNSVKVVLGFLELALALKFLSNADLVEQWGLIKRETFIAIWIILGLGLTAYLFGLIRFPHDSKVQKLSYPRIGFALLVFAFVIYLVPGLTCGENSYRALISGFPPPVSQSFCNYKDIAANDENAEIKILQPEHDLYEGLEKAKRENKPVLIDFTGWACVNCRKVEENIWVDSAVNNLLYDDYVIISLYVDDRRELPEELKGSIDITYSNGEVKKKKIRTIGDKWSTFEILSFENNSQPRYAVLNHDGTLLTPPIGYSDIVKNGYTNYYQEYLECGLDAYKKVNP